MQYTILPIPKPFRNRFWLTEGGLNDRWSEFLLLNSFLLNFKRYELLCKLKLLAIFNCDSNFAISIKFLLPLHLFLITCFTQMIFNCFLILLERIAKLFIVGRNQDLLDGSWLWQHACCYKFSLGLLRVS